MNSVLVDFEPAIGWRVRGRAPYDASIEVLKTDGKKLLRIPSLSVLRNGHFCNPRKVVFQHFYAKHPHLRRP